MLYTYARARHTAACAIMYTVNNSRWPGTASVYAIVHTGSNPTAAYGTDVWNAATLTSFAIGND